MFFYNRKLRFVTNAKANGANDHGKVEGYTKYDAIRLIENGDGLFINLNDPTFSRSSLEHGSHNIFIPFTLVTDCKRQLTTSTANLARTSIKFSPSVLPYHPRGFDESGGAVLTSNSQVMTITSRGFCGETYFDDGALLLTDDHPVLEEHLLPVNFLNEHDSLTGECLKLYSWGVNQTNE